MSGVSNQPLEAELVRTCEKDSLMMNYMLIQLKELRKKFEMQYVREADGVRYRTDMKQWCGERGDR